MTKCAFYRPLCFVLSFLALFLYLFYGSPEGPVGAIAKQVCAVNALPATNPPPEQNRLMVFISDLHMGIGCKEYSENGKNCKKWYKTEDFRWHKAFDDFLRRIDREGKQRVDLVMVGDTFELWQSLKNDCNYEALRNKIGRKAFDMGCNETEAVDRIKHVIKEHKQFFKSASWFALQGENRITLLPGNHDVALFFPAVREKVITAFDVKARSRVEIATAGYWLSADGRVFAEHGQQIGADTNCFHGWPSDIFIEHNRKKYLRRPFGEQFVQQQYNQIEEKFPTIDNLSEEIKGVHFARDVTSFPEEVDAIIGGIRFIVTQTSLSHIGQFLDENKVPKWDFGKVQSSLDSSEKQWKFLVESLSPKDPLRISLQNKDLNALPPADLSLQEIEAICNRRWLLNSSNPELLIRECDRIGDQLDWSVEIVVDLINPKAKNKRFRKYLREVQQAIPEESRPKREFELYVFGHTHNEQNDYLPFDSEVTSNQKWNPVVFNSGAWQRTTTPEVWCTIVKMKEYPDNEAMERMSVEDLPACYPFVWSWVDAESNKLKTELRYWVVRDGHGTINLTCSVAPKPQKECLDKSF
jgi:UDP-2,3-diacylglucosamine pyrophosphatase LpxH